MARWFCLHRRNLVDYSEPSLEQSAPLAGQPLSLFGMSERTWKTNQYMGACGRVNSQPPLLPSPRSRTWARPSWRPPSDVWKPSHLPPQEWAPVIQITYGSDRHCSTKHALRVQHKYTSVIITKTVNLVNRTPSQCANACFVSAKIDERSLTSIKRFLRSGKWNHSSVSSGARKGGNLAASLYTKISWWSVCIQKRTRQSMDTIGDHADKHNWTLSIWP